MSETISGVPYSVVVSGVVQQLWYPYCILEGCQTRCLILKLVEYVLIVIALSTINHYPLSALSIIKAVRVFVCCLSWEGIFCFLNKSHCKCQNINGVSLNDQCYYILGLYSVPILLPQDVTGEMWAAYKALYVKASDVSYSTETAWLDCLHSWQLASGSRALTLTLLLGGLL